MPTEFFSQRPKSTPQIYVYSLPDVPKRNGFLKIGYTTRDAETRVKEQTHTSGLKAKILCTESAMRSDGSIFTDKDIHRILRRKGFIQLNEGEDRNEWYQCTVEDVKAAVLEARDGIITEAGRTASFSMRPEQQRAVETTKKFFLKEARENPTRIPKFLWNAKMRFGKTFASYQLARAMGFKRVLILTFKPVVEAAWSEDLKSHVDFQGWQFVSNKDASGYKLDIDKEYEAADKDKPIVVFGSFQDLLGKNENGGIKAKNVFIHNESWDLVIFDEYHFGAWRDNAKKLFEVPDEEEGADPDPEEYQQKEAGDAYNETYLPITAKYYLYLSGTPFRALNTGEFLEDQIFNWTYPDEQNAKASWKGANNPYRALPRMVMLAYVLPEKVRKFAEGSEFNEFDLNEFFKAEVRENGREKEAIFPHEEHVQKWLDLIRGNLAPSEEDLGSDPSKRPPMPYSDGRLRNILSHTLWFLPNVASCKAMYSLMQRKDNRWYTERYNIIVCAGSEAGIGLDALKPVLQEMGDPLATQTITLSCGKLTTGVTVKPWTGVFMLRNLKSPETYFQTAFRAQSPWVVRDDKGKEQIMKEECYVFDFALNRALRQIADYCGMDGRGGNPEQKVADFIHFLPVLAYDGSSMREISAQEVLDFVTAGTSATLLARRWESALLVNVDNDTLQRILNSPEALAALKNIEGFRSLNKIIDTILTKSSAIKKIKKGKKPSKGLSQKEKELKTQRRMIQQKLIKFVTRIPIFMYLTDDREHCLEDVIRQQDPELFKEVTGLTLADFDLLCKLGVFNTSLMDDAIFKFKRYEDASLSYAGINKHAGENIGGFSTVRSASSAGQIFYNQA